MPIGAIGGWYTSGSLYSRHAGTDGGWYSSGSLYRRGGGQENGWYTSGALHARFSGTGADALNARAIDSLEAGIAAAATSIFGQLSSASEQLSILTAQQYQARVLAEAQAESQAASTVLDLSV